MAMTRTRVLDGIDLFDPRVYVSGIPYEAFARLRRCAPVAWHEEPEIMSWPAGPGFWAVTRHADVAEVSRNAALFSAHAGATQLRDPSPQDLPFIQQMMLNMDPPEHSRLRQMMNTGFTPRQAAKMEPTIRRYATQVVDAIAPRGACDFAEEVGADFPLLTLCAVMGIPIEDRRLLFEWTKRVIGYQDDEYADVPVDPGTGEPINPRSPGALRDMFDYADELAVFKRRQPGDDLISTLLHAEVEGERISNEEFQMMFFLFVIAGNDTTHSAVPGGMLSLIEHPAQRALLLYDLDLLPGAIEEMLRYAPPVIHFRRTATQDIELGGEHISAGEKVVVFYPSANRDEAVISDPDSFDIRRGRSPHLTFGIGPHFCLGNALARVQMRVLFHELLTRIPDVELAGPVERLTSNFINGVKRMPVRFTPVGS